MDTNKSLDEFRERLVRVGVLTESQLTHLLVASDENVWDSPFLRSVPEHTRAYVEHQIRSANSRSVPSSNESTTRRITHA